MTNRYYAEVTDHLTTLFQRHLFQKITLQDVTRCYGTPTGYSWLTDFQADTHRSQFIVWYPLQGYAFSTGNFYTAKAPVIRLNESMPIVFVVAPDTVKDMASDIFASPNSDYSAVEAISHHFTEWPDEFKEIQLGQ